MIEDGRVATQGTGTWEGTLMGGGIGGSPSQLSSGWPFPPHPSYSQSCSSCRPYVTRAWLLHQRQAGGRK